MRVRISMRGQPACPLAYLDQTEAQKVPYTNKITGASDPMIVFTPPQ